MQHTQRFVVLLIIFLFSSYAAASDSVKVEDLVELAVSRNPELKALGFETEAQRSFAKQASKWENPDFEVGAERKNQPIGQTDFTRIGLSQAIPRPGRLRARATVATAAARLSEVARTTSELHLRHEVLRLIYEYLAATEKATHAKERLERFQTVGTYLRSRVFVAPQKQAEAGIVRAKQLILGKEFRELEALRRSSWLQLNLHLGLPSEPAIQSNWFHSGHDYKLERLLATAATQSPLALNQDIKISQIESQLELAKTESWNGLTVHAAYANGAGADPERIYGLGVSFPLPLLHTNAGTIRGTESQAEAERQRRSWIHQQIETDIKSAFERYNAAKISLAALKVDDIPKFEREMNSVDQNFKKGQVDLLTYIEADLQHSESLNAILDSQIEFVTARSALLELAGQSSTGAE